jgi:hypothetical protein
MEEGTTGYFSFGSVADNSPELDFVSFGPGADKNQLKIR